MVPPSLIAGVVRRSRDAPLDARLSIACGGEQPMCGIAGILERKSGVVDRVMLQRMVYALSHRGPDGQGVHIDGEIGLGHARLSIIDLAGGKQPMSNPEGTIW